MLNIQRYILFVCLSMMRYFSSGYATPKYYTKHYYAGTDYADSGSLQHDIAIQLSVIPRKGGTLMPSNMENVSRMGDGMRLLPNGQHFSDSVPALLSLAYDPDRIPMGYKPTDI